MTGLQIAVLLSCVIYVARFAIIGVAAVAALVWLSTLVLP